MYWTNLSNKTIGIWGMGREGQAAKQALLCHCQNINILEISEENTADIFKCEVLIKSPGISIYRDEIKQAAQQGIQITSGTNLYFANKNKSVFTIAVTGTKGKSTTSSLLAHTLTALGHTTELSGNIGQPLLNFVDKTPEFMVAELSSYQCADFDGKPDIGVLVNLYPEHLQWHKSHETYYQDKLHLIRAAKHSVLNQENTESVRLSMDLSPIWFNNTQGIHIHDGFFYDGATPLFSTSKLNLIGKHNAENACAVLTVIKLLGLPLQGCAHAFLSFKPLPHRLEILGEKEGITYVDDSISTTPETAIAALMALDRGQPITLIAGGLNRGQDYTELVHYMQPYRNRMHLVTLPDTGIQLADLAQRAGIETALANDMPTAVSLAQHLTPSGGLILLSPAAPSYNLYQNFEERGNDFKKWAFSL